MRFRIYSRRGAAVVEFAIVAPVFLLLIMGTIEYGRMIMVQQIVVNASREGARQAILEGATSAIVSTTVNSYLQGHVPGAQISITPDPATVSSGDPIRVEVSVAYADVSWLPSPMFLGNRSLSAFSVMLKE